MRRFNEKNLSYAVVTDIDHINGLQTARLLSERNIPVIGLGKDLKHYCAKTSVCKKIISADTKSDALVRSLINVAKDLEAKPVLFICQDTSVLIVSRNRKELEEYYHIALPEESVLEMLMDKPSFFEYAVKENFPIAKYFLIKSPGDAEKAIEQVSFPCILKPPIKSPLWESNTKIKAYKIISREEFFKIYNMCSPWADVLMLQEWIEGDDTDLYSCNCYYNKNNEPLVSFVAKKLRQYPPVTGNTSLGIECKEEIVRDETLKLFSKVGYSGLGYVELKRDRRTGKFYMIEPNIGRPTGRSALAEAAGVEILATMYADLLGLPLPEERTQLYKGVKWIQIRTDLSSAFYYWRKGELTISDYIKSVRGKKYFAVFSLKDPKPFLFEILTAIKVISKAITQSISKIFSKNKIETKTAQDLPRIPEVK